MIKVLYNLHHDHLLVIINNTSALNTGTCYPECLLHHLQPSCLVPLQPLWEVTGWFGAQEWEMFNSKVLQWLFLHPKIARTLIPIQEFDLLAVEILLRVLQSDSLLWVKWALDGISKKLSLGIEDFVRYGGEDVIEQVADKWIHNEIFDDLLKVVELYLTDNSHF